MRISTNMLYSQLSGHMSQAASDLARLQGQVASGNKFNTASQAPDVVARALAIESRLSGFQADVDTVGQVRMGVDAQASAMESSQTLLSRLKELSLQGASQQYTQTERDAIAVEVHSLKASLVDLANAKDPNGRYVFSGTNSSTPPYVMDANGVVTYQGGTAPLRVKIGDSGYEDATAVGPAAWQGVVRPAAGSGTPQRVDLFGVVSDLEQSLRTNSRQDISRAVDELTTVADHVQTSMAKLGASQNRLQLAQTTAEDLTTRAKTALSDIKDLDYATALGDLKKQETLLQASQSLLGRLSQLSLLEYMR